MIASYKPVLIARCPSGLNDVVFMRLKGREVLGVVPAIHKKKQGCLARYRPHQSMCFGAHSIVAVSQGRSSGSQVGTRLPREQECHGRRIPLTLRLISVRRSSRTAS